jgi:low affinity Fe/Cu permease
MGSSWGFMVACFTVVVWSLLGPHYRYSDTWQLVINTSTTIVTFLMAFLIQRTQNREAYLLNQRLAHVLEAQGDVLVELSRLREEVAAFQRPMC